MKALLVVTSRLVLFCLYLPKQRIWPE